MSRFPYYYAIDRQYIPARRRPWLGAGILLSVGIALGLWVVMPMAWYQLVESPRIGYRSFVSPINQQPKLTPNTTGTVAGSATFDHVNANTWFPDAHVKKQGVAHQGAQTYRLTIPKLTITKATVMVDSEDLSKSLVHYPGTTLPGYPGNAVIFGHSVLPQFFNPKNYMTIFSTLHTLSLGDSVFVEYDGITYHYQIYDMFEVKPDEISVLSQDTADSVLTIITCTPPGTYLRRLVVKSRLVPLDEYDYEHATTTNSRN